MKPPGATIQPLGPFLRKKGLRREAEIPFVIAMVPKGGLDRGESRRSTPSTLAARRPASGLLKSPSSSLIGRRRAPVRVPAEHQKMKKGASVQAGRPGHFLVPKGGLEPPRVSPPPL